MASPAGSYTHLSSVDRRIASFVVLDLETTGLPHLMSKTAITELCMYGFSASELEAGPAIIMCNSSESPVPNRPRILHKLTMLFNPRRLIHPDCEEITGLSNYTLEGENHFDENAGNTIINFLKHMQQPVCLVAHNGDFFDFPIVKQTFDKLKLEMPCGTLCVDSLRAFWGIDEQLKSIGSDAETSTRRVLETDAEPQILPVPDSLSTEETKELLDSKPTAIAPILYSANPEDTTLLHSKPTLVEQLDSEAKVDWRAHNETTPRRPTVSGVKRPHSDESTPRKKSLNDNVGFKSKRALFARKKEDKYPPKSVYKLANIYERYFKEKPKDVHFAEGDVETLMHVMKIYGVNFLAYAENHAIPFEEIKRKR
ncbi:uncharacterized protein LOC129248219 [Anastrepha obliqua]|uniref:uncharacterized protein LOC129248219 n=1 Tax=Anastrepha obliqua TaxID=95512 RepID=UPI00240952C9|nr:uncharacterized protein LOC129248219 [Anastrepha obliqua]